MTPQANTNPRGPDMSNPPLPKSRRSSALCYFSKDIMFSLLSRRASTSVLWSRPLHSSAWRSSAAATSLPLPTGLDDGEKAIFQKLTERFNPSELLVQDVSGTSQSSVEIGTKLTLYGHSTWLIGGCGSFYAIQIKSEAFKGIPMIKQHRMVNDTLKKEIEGIHGLQVRVS